MMRILVTGAGGMLARDLIPRLHSDRPSKGFDVVESSRAQLDVSDEAAVHRTIKELHPAVVINCAAYTDVDGCETHAELAMKVNGAGPGYLAAACKTVDALLIHMSTDFVFDGRSNRPCQPDDPPNPLSIYGRSKLEGERAIQASGGRHLLVRTSWLFGFHGRNFVEAILKKSSTGESLRVVTDQKGRPTYTVDLADGLMRLLDAGTEGIVHFANGGECTWNEFAAEIVRQVGHRVDVAAITSKELARPAQRPAYSVLDLSSFVRATGHTPSDWKDALGRYLAERRASRS